MNYDKHIEAAKDLDTAYERTSALFHEAMGKLSPLCRRVAGDEIFSNLEWNRGQMANAIGMRMMRGMRRKFPDIVMDHPTAESFMLRLVEIVKAWKEEDA